MGYAIDPSFSASSSYSYTGRRYNSYSGSSSSPPSSTRATKTTTLTTHSVYTNQAITNNANATRTTTYLPLTTIFTPPARCANLPYTYSTQISGLSTFWRGANATVYPACYPYDFPFQTSAPTVEYSAGVCPYGYTAATSATNIQRHAAMSWCCPTGMSYAQDYGCFTTITTPTVVMANPTSSFTMTSAFVAADYYIQVAWASDQLDLFTPASAPILGQLATQTATTNSSNSTNIPFMNPEQIAGVSIGVPVAMAVIALACYSIWRQKRRSSRGVPLNGDMAEAAPSSSPSSGVMTEYKRSDSAQVESPEAKAQNGGMQRHSTYHGNFNNTNYNANYTYNAPMNVPEPPPMSQRSQRFSFGVQELQGYEIPRQQQQYNLAWQDRYSMDETQHPVMPR